MKIISVVSLDFLKPLLLDHGTKRSIYRHIFLSTFILQSLFHLQHLCLTLKTAEEWKRHFLTVENTDTWDP